MSNVYNTLSEITIIEIGGLASTPYASHLLVEMGARVISLEPPSGKLARHYGPFPGGNPDIEHSALHTFLDTGKESVIFDFDDESDQLWLTARLKSSDIFLTALNQDELRKAGLDYQTLKETHPHLIYCAISTFGLTGLYRDRNGSAIHAGALSSTSWAIGSLGRPPLQLPLTLSEIQGGVHAAAATMAALIQRNDTGGGQFIDISLADIFANYAGIQSTLFIYYGLQWQRAGHRASGTMGPYPLGSYPCKDGMVVIIARSTRDWAQFLKAMGNPAWADNPRYRDQVAMGRDYPDEVDALIAPLIARYTQQELFKLARKWGFPLAPVNTVAQALDEPQFAHRQFFRELILADGHRLKIPQLPFQFSEGSAMPPRCAPRLGEHSEAVRAEMPAAIKLTMTNQIKKRPLEGVRVLDLGWVWAGPVATGFLADLGAEVIKVEHTKRLDNARLRGAPTIDGKRLKIPGKSIELGPLYHGINRHKLSIRLNIKTEQGAELLRDLVAQSDIVLENFTPGTLTKLGLDYASLKTVRPDLIMISLSSAGQSGPIADLKGYAPVLSAYSGLESLLAYPGEEPIGMLNFGLNDMSAGIHALYSILVALHHRRNSQQGGQYIDFSQLEVGASSIAEAIIDQQWNGADQKITQRKEPQPVNPHPLFTPHGHFRCAGSDQWIAISVESNEQWQQLKKAAGNPVEWRAINSLDERRTDEAGIEQQLTHWTLTQNRDQLADRLNELGVPATPLLSIEEQFKHPQFASRQLRQKAKHSLLGEIDLYRIPWQMSGIPLDIHSAGPLLGEHDDYVYGNLLGLKRSTIEQLKQQKVIY